jgi:hypothetical protein
MSNSFRTSGKSGHIRTFLSRQHNRKSWEKCNCEWGSPGVRTQSGHFRLAKMHGGLSFRGPLQAYGEAHDRAHHGAHDQAHDQAYDEAYDGQLARQNPLAKSTN